MVFTQLRSTRKTTGGRYKGKVVKRRSQIAGAATLTKLGKDVKRKDTGRGGNPKTRLISAETVNLFDPKTKKHVKTKIKLITENAASRHFVTRNILTKGTIVETEKGKARITSRPGQEGTLNAVLI